MSILERRAFWFSGNKQAWLDELNVALASGATVQHFGVTGEGVMVIVTSWQKNNPIQLALESNSTPE